MTKYGSADVGFLLADGYDLLGTSTGLGIDVEAVTEPTHGLGDAWEEHSDVGVRRAAITQDGFYDDVANGMNEALVGLATRVLCVGQEGNTEGVKCTCFSGALQTRYGRVLSRDALHKASAAYTGHGIVEDAAVIQTHTALVAASGESSAQDNGASSADGGSGYLQVSALALGGYTNVVIKLRDSADDITYADLIAFTAVTAAPTAERLTVAGTVDRYVHATYAFTGSGSSQSVTPLVAFKRN